MNLFDLKMKPLFTDLPKVFEKAHCELYCWKLRTIDLAPGTLPSSGVILMKDKTISEFLAIRHVLACLFSLVPCDSF